MKVGDKLYCYNNIRDKDLILHIKIGKYYCVVDFDNTYINILNDSNIPCRYTICLDEDKFSYKSFFYDISEYRKFKLININKNAAY